MKPMLLHCQKIDITLLLYQDDAFILEESCMQARIDGQGVASILQRIGFILSHDECQLDPAQLFTHLGLTFNTKEMTISLSRDKIKALKAHVARIALLSMCQCVTRLLGLTNLQA